MGIAFSTPGAGAPLDPWRIPVTRLRAEPDGVGPHGHRIPGKPRPEALPPALFEQVGDASLIAAGVSATVASPVVYWPWEWPDVRAGDRLEIDGETWLVHERPARTPMGLRVSVTGSQRKENTP